MGSAYLIGRASQSLQASIAPPTTLSDKLFAGERLDGQTLQGLAFSHCTFANISFKDVLLKQTSFTDCVFFECYFRKTRLEGCTFSGTRFIDCRMPHVQIRSSAFSYVGFRGCHVPFDEIEHSLPAAPNEREQLTLNLAQESERAGESRQAYAYRLAAFSARREHLVAAVLGKSSWYREHFTGVGRVKAAFEVVRLAFNRVLWGYGESLGRLVANYLVLMSVVFPLLFYWFRSAFQSNGNIPGTAQLIGLSCSVMLRVSAMSSVIPTNRTGLWLLGIESFVSLLFVALFGSYLFRWIVRR